MSRWIPSTHGHIYSWAWVDGIHLLMDTHHTRVDGTIRPYRYLNHHDDKVSHWAPAKLSVVRWNFSLTRSSESAARPGHGTKLHVDNHFPVVLGQPSFSSGTLVNPQVESGARARKASMVTVVLDGIWCVAFQCTRERILVLLLVSSERRERILVLLLVLLRACLSWVRAEYQWFLMAFGERPGRSLAIPKFSKVSALVYLHYNTPLWSSIWGEFAPISVHFESNSATAANTTPSSS